MRERITISIKKDLLNKIDQQIDGSRIRNRSHAIEHFVSETLGIADINNAVILAGGEGALKLIPTIEFYIEEFKSFGINEVYLAVGYLGTKIREYVGDGTKFGLKINYIESGDGTGGAIKKLREKFKKSFIVINTDERMSIDFKKLIAYHRKNLSISTIATKELKNFKGVYIFEPEVFKIIPNGFSMLEKDLFPKLFDENMASAFPLID
jgi:NDP-sugar pyrophosphorylase family protein